MSTDLTISIVLYQSDEAKLRRAIDSVLNTSLEIKIFLIDNSPTDVFRKFASDPRCEYIFNNGNIGFGRAHNIAIKKALMVSKYHLVLNPDVYFDGDVLQRLFLKMESDNTIGLITPKILYPDGRLQHLCKLLPSPIDLFGRRFAGKAAWVQRRNRIYEIHDSGYNREMNIPYLSGCFMFLRTSVLKEIGFFDERIFMYIEDADLTRRIHAVHRTVFFPEVIVYHSYEKGSYKSLRLMWYNIHGAAVYFSKWGWLFDSQRKLINQRVINNYVVG